MERLNEILSETGISKVKLAKYLGVSRQMVYNYLEMDNINDWPLEKKLKLLNLLDIKSQEDIENIKVDNDFIKHANSLINEDTTPLLQKGRVAFTNLNKDNQKLLNDIINLLKELLEESEETGSNEGPNIVKYLYYFLEAIDSSSEIKYILAYIAKTTGFITANEFVFNKEEQFEFESILYQSMIFYNSKGASKNKLIDVHKKFEAEIEEKHEEVLSRTQELTSAKEQALKELGYTELNSDNSTEVFMKMAEIQSRKV